MLLATLSILSLLWHLFGNFDKFAAFLWVIYACLQEGSGTTQSMAAYQTIYLLVFQVLMQVWYNKATLSSFDRDSDNVARAVKDF